MTMSYLGKAGQTHNTFCHLLKELEKFVDTRDIKLAFDREGNAYLQGKGFSEQLQANPDIHRLVAAEMREIIAKHVPRIHPAE